MAMRFCACALALVVALVGPSCGSDGEHTDNHSEPVDPTAPQLAMVATSFNYDPKNITVPAGEKRTLVMKVKDIQHDFTVDELDIHVHGDAGDTVRQTLTFDKPGKYTFYCSISGHRAAGMTGTLTVT